MEPLFLLTIPRFDMPEFGSLDEDYLCREDQLSWYLSEQDIMIEPVRVLEESTAQADCQEWEYMDGEYKNWYFFVEKASAQCVYIRQNEVYHRCVKVKAENVLIEQKKMEEEERGSEIQMHAYRRVERIAGFSGILSIKNLSARATADLKEVLHNEIESNLYYLEREFETVEEMKEDVNNPAPLDLRRFFEDILEQK